MKKVILLFSIFNFQFSIFNLSSAQTSYTRADTLRGMLSPLRTCYDVTYYELTVKVDLEKQAISGNNIIHYKTLNDFDKLQIDLFENMQIDSIVHNDMQLKFSREFNAVFVSFPEKQANGKNDFIKVYYHGKPVVAKKAPWDGGFVWQKDKNGKHWVGVACEGIGASLWFPCKDHLSDEPDSVKINCIIPPGLTCVSNGRSLGVTPAEDETGDFAGMQHSWFVSYPINSYNITLNIAEYAHFSDKYKSGNEMLDLDYYVLPYNMDKAKETFEQNVKPMLSCYEKYFGKYPFWHDGYKLVETPYWGMEHQSCISYGNNYQKDKWGFDFIIVHESGHEWWGNNVSCTDIAETWIHESFTTYAEALYMENFNGYEKMLKYITEQKFKIQNRMPIIGPLNVNDDDWAGTDQYFKGSWMLHTLRNVLDNDMFWFNILKGIQTDFAYKTVNTKTLMDYISKKAGTDLTYFFNQYLRYPNPPKFVYKLKSKGKDLILNYKWEADVADFKMPIKVTTSKENPTATNYQMIFPTKEWQELRIENLEPEEFKIAEDRFYVTVKKEEN